jgi:fermentation-respiration switch protein FrsA (DUF1100 family)
MRHDVEFPAAHGTRLRGWLYLPDGRAGRVPGVAMAHGFSATKEMALDRFAEVFAAAGVAALVYDHRNFGASDGEPRQEINPWAQARDYRFALGWLAARPEVDPARLAVWGSSFSGGEVIAVGACDPRVRAVVENVPFAGLPGVDYADRDDVRRRFERLRAALLDESGAGPADRPAGAVGPMKVVSERPGEACFLPQPESARWFLAAGRAPGARWRNEFTLRSGAADAPPWDPGVCVPFVAPRALLMVVATEDRLAATDVALASFDRAGEPKQLEIVPGDHFAPYDGEAFARSSAAMAEFLRRSLGA